MNSTWPNPWMDLSKIFDKTIGGVNKIKFRSISVGIGSIYFFLFESLDVRASENLSDS